MLIQMTDAKHNAAVMRAIENAEKVAGKDDVAFVRELRAKFFSDPRLQTGSLRRATGRRTPVVEPDLQIFEDPRFVRNARALAQRTKTGMRILGGTSVHRTDFPDCVAVGDNHEWFCSGTLVASNAVLTAGHCNCEANRVRPTRVFFGNNVNRRGKIVRVSRILPHPEYQPPSNDLMVLLLGTKVTDVASRTIAPSNLIEAATDVRAVGFGNTDPDGTFGYGIKRQTDVPIASHSCQGSVKGESDQAYYGCRRRLELIAGKPLLAKDTCSGDSGGPIYVSTTNGNWLLAGATSRSSKIAGEHPEKACGDGGVYVRVDRYRQWIKSVPGINL